MAFGVATPATLCSLKDTESPTAKPANSVASTEHRLVEPLTSQTILPYYLKILCFTLLIRKTINAAAVMLAVMKIIQKTMNAVSVMPVNMY